MDKHRVPMFKKCWKCGNIVTSTTKLCPWCSSHVFIGDDKKKEKKNGTK